MALQKPVDEKLFVCCCVQRHRWEPLVIKRYVHPKVVVCTGQGRRRRALSTQRWLEPALLDPTRTQSFTVQSVAVVVGHLARHRETSEFHKQSFRLQRSLSVMAEHVSSVHVPVAKFHMHVEVSQRSCEVESAH